jgi:hypothetical protein
MKLSPNELLNKFKCLEKFKDQKWLSEESIKEDCNYKQLPLKAALALIQEIISFIETTKFNSRWEEGFSIKIRLQQMNDLLLFFCEDTIEEKTRKGTNLRPQHPIDKRHMPEEKP